MEPIVIGLAFLTFLSTLIGGITAIKLKNVLPYLFAFASGALIAITFFDLLPESLQLADSISMPIRYVMAAVVASFLFYSLVERYVLTHHHHEDNDEHGHVMGPIGAGSLAVHSFLDGVAIGAAYMVNPATGLIVALAVICHDFTDGINTVTLMLKNNHTTKKAAVFLFMDAIAPVLGILLTLAFKMDEAILAVLLAIFSGEFLYIGAASLLPETHKHTPWKMALFMTLGIALIFVLTSVI